MKYFNKISKTLAGLIFIFGSMLDAVAITSVINQETILAVVFIGLRAGVAEFKTLYLEGQKTSEEPASA